MAAVGNTTGTPKAEVADFDWCSAYGSTLFASKD
jgi:hypothetical protein